MHHQSPIVSPAVARSSALAIVFGLLACWPACALAEGERLVRLQFCQDVRASEGVDCGEAFPAGADQVHALMAIGVPPGKSGEVTAIWRHEGRPVQRQVLTIRFYRPGGYRTRARQRILRSRTGRWSLEVLDSAGRSLTRRAFTVGVEPSGDDGTAAQPAATDAAVESTVDAALAPDADPDGGVAPDAAFFVLDGGLDPPDASAPDAAPADAAPADAMAVVEPAAPATPPPAAAPIAADAPEDDDRRRGGLMLLIGGFLLLVAGVLIARRRAGRPRVAATPEPALAPEPQPATPRTPAAAPTPGGAGPTDVTPVVAAVVPPAATAPAPAGSEAATDALQRLTDLVTSLWSRWVAATGGSPQRALNTAWRAVPDAGRLGLDHIRLCNALESAAQDYSAIPPRGSSSDILRIRLYAQSPALIGVICALAVEVDRLDLQGVGLERAFSPWGGRAGLTAELLGILDDGAAALGTARLALLPYETKAATAQREFDADLKPFPLPVALVERLNAGNRIVRVETAPFDDSPRPVVWGANVG